MNDYADFKQLFLHICEIKAFVLKLSSEDLKKYRHDFFNQKKYKEWCLSLIWDYIYGDISYLEIYDIFKKSKLI